ncbi:MAG TPA: hypothetical protein VFY99_05460 [Solirubrobacterales bacterium]
MPKKLSMLLAVVLTTGLVAAGCGDDDDETTTSSTTTTTEGTSGATGATGAEVSEERAALIEEADAICEQGDKEIDAEAQEVFGNSNQEPPASEQEAFVEDTVVPNIQDQLDQLSELDPPEEDAEEFQGIIDDAQAALDEVADDPSVIGSGDDPFTEVNRRAQEFGLTACGGN